MPADTLLITARILAGGGFFIIGLRNIRNHGEVTGLMRARHIPLPPVSAATGIGMQIIFGALLALGVLQTISALGLALFVVMATAIAHSPFMGAPAERRGNLATCLMNAATVGGFLSLAAAGL
jgi:uncharacterized membrane protein YphA (DoxX/SURF4 family)